MDRLPQEILRNITGWLSKEDLFSTRLVNKSLAAASAPSLFHTIPLWIGLSRLEGFSQLSERPDVAIHVKEIEFSTISFIDYKDNEATQEAQIRRLLDREHDSLSARALAYVRYMSAYNNYITAQRNLAKDGMDMAILNRALRKLPRFEALILDWYNDRIGSAEIVNAFGMLEVEHLVTYNGAHTVPVFFHALTMAGIRLRYLHFGNSFYELDSKVTTPLSCQELRRTRCRLPSVVPEMICHGSFLALTPNIIGDTFDPVRELVINTYEMSEMLLDDNSEDHFRAVLSAVRPLISLMSSVKSLTIASCASLYVVPLADAIPLTRYFIHLKLLDVASIGASQSELVGVLGRHAGLLVDVEFAYVYFTDSRWFDVVTRLKESNWSALKRFSLVDVQNHEGSFGVDVEDYLLGKSGINTFPRDD